MSAPNPLDAKRLAAARALDYVLPDMSLGLGTGETNGSSTAAFLEAGWVDRISARDEFAANVSFTRVWQSIDGYSEPVGADNPLAAIIPGGTDTLNIAGLNAQYTHLFGATVEADINGGVQYAFDGESGLSATADQLAAGASQRDFVYYQLGARLGFRVTDRLAIDLFANAQLAPDDIGSSVHGGFGVRWSL